MIDIAQEVASVAGVPVYRYRSGPHLPPVAVHLVEAGHPPGHGRPQIHEFPVLVYVERARRTAEVAVGTSGHGHGSTQAGDAYLAAPGVVIDPAVATSCDLGHSVAFDPEALGAASWPSWASHPLLASFLHGAPGGLLRLTVPVERRPVWSAALAAIENEAAEQATGYCEAMLAHLTVLLVDVARLATDVVGDLRRSAEPLLAEVFDIVERRHAAPMSLRDVAHAVGISPGHLTTVVRRRTGRTVGDWITERRMTEARRLLTTTDLPISRVAALVGLPDPGYFARVFKRANGTSPREWRALAKVENGTRRW